MEDSNAIVIVSQKNCFDFPTYQTTILPRGWYFCPHHNVAFGVTSYHRQSDTIPLHQTCKKIPFGYKKTNNDDMTS